MAPGEPVVPSYVGAGVGSGVAGGGVVASSLEQAATTTVSSRASGIEMRFKGEWSPSENAGSAG
jgi:hypothetical protein